MHNPDSTDCAKPLVTGGRIGEGFWEQVAFEKHLRDQMRHFHRVFNWREIKDHKHRIKWLKDCFRRFWVRPRERRTKARRRGGAEFLFAIDRLTAELAFLERDYEDGLEG